MNPHRNLKTFNSSSFMSKNERSNKFRSDQPQTVDFQEYLRTEHQEHQEPSQSESQSFDYRQESNTNISYEQNMSSNSENLNKNLIEIGQNYTFAEEMSSNRKQNLIYVNFNDSLSIARRKRISPQNLEKQIQKYPQLNLDSSGFTEEYPKSRSDFSSSYDERQKQISLSDNEEDQGVTIYKSKTIQEEMFLKISQQTKQIISLQQKLYYYEDFCKRLLKDHQEDTQQINKLTLQVNNLKKNSKEKSSVIKQLEKKIKQQQKQFQQKQKTLQQKEKELKRLTFVQKQLKKHQQNSKKHYAQKRILTEKQNIQEINHIQAQKKLINEKYQHLLSNYDKVKTKLLLLQGSLEKYQKENEVLKKKNKNLQNVNKILEKQIEVLNIKIFKFEREMQEITCQNYASNLTRIKCMTQTSTENFSINNQLKYGKFDTLGFDKSQRLRR